jgi:hypothetical protein
MQSEADDKIQGRLESAGKGLPRTDAFVIKRVGFPILKRCMSWKMGIRLFESEGEKIVNSVEVLDEPTLFKRVLIPRTIGIEDNSRYYSPAMVLWHLIYVGKTIQDGIISLSRSEQLDFVVKIENFKPFVAISPNIVDEYKLFLKAYRPTIEAHVQNRFIRNYHVHPWFGPLNPHHWLIMSAIHQLVHRRQLGKIVALNA